MKKLKIMIRFLCFCLILLIFVQRLDAQGYGSDLTFQGLDHTLLHSAAARASGGLTVGMKQDIGLMFQNPAALYSLQEIQVSLGGIYFLNDQNQDQQYAPVRYYSNLSLLLEGVTGQIPDPPPDTTSTTPWDSAMNSIQRPFDNLKPYWSRSRHDQLPLLGMLAVPVTLGEIKIVAGLGAVQYASMNHYYQNNNVLDPSILSQRPLPTLKPTNDNPLQVDWLQSVRSRAGEIQGYGFALASGLPDFNLSFGFSGMILDGSTDDYEQQVTRGKLTFYSNAFRLDSVYHRINRSGTSDFNGYEFTFGSILGSRYLSIGFAVKFPATITRKYSLEVRTDTTGGTPALSSVTGKDKLKLPWRGTVGLALTPRENLTIGLEYEIRPFKSVRYTAADGMESTPWLQSSLFRVGLEYQAGPWLTLRGGMRGEAEVFQAEGSYIEKEPVTYTVYSAGYGVTYLGLRFNMTYEYSLMKYQDIWSTAISKNNEWKHTLMAQLTYEIPWMWK
jgi:opacity protein-like surface antigen